MKANLSIGCRKSQDAMCVAIVRQGSRCLNYLLLRFFMIARALSNFSMVKAPSK